MYNLRQGSCPCLFYLQFSIAVNAGLIGRATAGHCAEDSIVFGPRRRTDFRRKTAKKWLILIKKGAKNEGLCTDVSTAKNI